MARLTPTQRNFTLEGGGSGGNNRRVRDATISKSISSMERALRTLSSPTSPPGPYQITPRRIDGVKKTSFKTVKQLAPQRLSSDSSSNIDSGGEEAVKVAIRVRPLASGGDQCEGRAFKASTDRNAIVEIPGGQLNIHPSSYHSTSNKTNSRRGSGDSAYLYDKVFSEDTNTCEIYHGLVRDIVQTVTKDGINGTIFTYGQTSSGKTYTMQGAGEDSSVGIIQLAAQDIFQSIKEEERNGSNTECTVNVSYVEIYNEELRDLLHDTSRKSSYSSLVIRENKKGTTFVEGLKEVAVRSLDQLMEVFEVGEKNKSVGSTKMNDRSSRSHAILTINLERKTVMNHYDVVDDKENSPGAAKNELVVKTTSSLNLVDLAGSESVRHTGASGMQKVEGGMINQSLTTLSRVLMSLGEKNRGHISYRDSKLTRMLKSSLSGKARMAVVCCITPSDKYVDETRSTLQFATRAKLVKTNATANEEVEDAGLIAKLRLEGAKAKLKNEKLEDRLRRIEKANENAITTERELANLKKFVFSEKSKKVTQSNVKPRRLQFSSVSFDDTQVGTTSRPLLEVNCPPTTSKDDMFIRPSSEEDDDIVNSNVLLRAALDFKANQVARLRRTKLGKDAKAREKRYSRLSGSLRTPDNDRRISMINAMRSPSSSPTSMPDQEDLAEKLASANSLIASFERQTDDLTCQKNDALDWIEELFAKQDQKDEKIRQISEEKYDAIKRCEELDDELVKRNEIVRSAERELEVAKEENEQLHMEIEAATVKITSIEEEIDSQDDSADKIEALNLELASAKEKYEMVQDSLIQVKEENMQLLHDQRLKTSEKVDVLRSPAQSPDDDRSVPELIKVNSELKSQVHELEDFTSEYCQEKRALVDQIDKYEEDLSHADALLKRKSDELDDALFSLVRERKTWITERKELLEKIESHVSSEDAEAEISRLREQQRQYVKDVDDCCEKMDVLSNELTKTQQQLQDATDHEEIAQERCHVLSRENSNLTESLSGAKVDIKQLVAQIQMTKKELLKEGKTKAQLSQSVSRVQELVDALSTENAELKDREKTRSHELQCLLSSVEAERHIATEERESLLKSNSSLFTKIKELSIQRDEVISEYEIISSEFNQLSSERDSAVREKEITERKLDKVAADFEADYETARSKVDILIVEKQDLEDKITFLEASKASIEASADRILERDNGLALRHDHLKAEYKKQTLMITKLQDEVNRLSNRLRGMKSINEQLSSDNRSIRKDIWAKRDVIQARMNAIDKRKSIRGTR